MRMIFLSLLLVGCVSSETSVGYAERAHPDCTGHRALSHSYGGENSSAQTEVQMTCDGQTRSITVKCRFGWGIISDTVCHENN